MPDPRDDVVCVAGRIDVAPGFACLLHDAGDGEVRLAVSGELDIATAPEVDQALRAAQALGDLVTLDLRRLEFMDCRGMRVVMEAATRAREDGGRFLVVRGPPNVERLFVLTGNDRRLETTHAAPADRAPSMPRLGR